MTGKPFVSVALCTYNGERFIKEQLESLVNQDYPNFEIIIADDCSTDNTRQILKACQEQNAAIKLYLNDTNLGFIKNFERSISLCSGQYIAMCDQDDVWVNNKISKLIAAIDNEVLVYHNSDFIDEQGNRIGNDSLGSQMNMYDGTSAIPFLFYNCIPGHTALFDRSLIEYALPFDPQFYHDWWLAYVAINIGKIKYVDDVLVHYRQHTNSITDMLKIRNDPAVKLPPVRNVERISLNVPWLKYCADFKFNSDPQLISKAYQLLSGLAERKGKFAGLRFLMKYYDLLFYFDNKPKSYLSKLNRMRKICFN